MVQISPSFWAALAADWWWKFNELLKFHQNPTAHSFKAFSVILNTDTNERQPSHCPPPLSVSGITTWTARTREKKPCQLTHRSKAADGSRRCCWLQQRSGSGSSGAGSAGDWRLTADDAVSEPGMTLEIRRIAEAVMTDAALQAAVPLCHQRRRLVARGRRWMSASLMYLEITDSVSWVVTVTTRKPLLYVVCLEMSPQVTQLHRLVIAPDTWTHTQTVRSLVWIGGHGERRLTE